MTDANFRPGVAAKIIADSISPSGQRLVTAEVTIHRFVLAEWNTHRVMSRNSASSRAIPFRKQVDRVMTQAAVPVRWATEQKGMQGGEPLTGDDAMDAEEAWLAARSDAVHNAMRLADMGVHKSVINRLLEPFMWHTIICTATEWSGFFHQRCHEAAQPEIRVAAEALRDAMSRSEPIEIDYGDWHLPLIATEDVEQVYDESDPYSTDGRLEPLDILKRISAARCARVSYLTHDGRRSLDKDLDLYERLTDRTESPDDPVHWSPLEHVATPCDQCRDGVHLEWLHSRMDSEIVGATPHPGNLRGWLQFRHELDVSPYVTRTVEDA